MSFDIGTWLFGFVAGASLTFQIGLMVHDAFLERERQR